MAKFSAKQLRQLPLAAWMWIGASTALLLVWLGMLAVIFLSGGAARELALESGKRVEFSLTKDGEVGELEGKLLRLADLAASEKTSEEAEEPSPITGEEILPPLDFVETPEAPEPKPSEQPTPAPVETSDPPPPPAPSSTPEPTATAKPAAAEPLTPVEKQVAEHGIIPMTAANGEMAWKYFAQGAGNDTYASGPRIAVVVYGLGLGALASEAALQLPPEVSLSFSPYGREAADWVARARQAGHEALLDLPMQTGNYPTMDPGPYGLLASLAPQENYTRLLTVLSRARGYVGLIAPHQEVVSDKAEAINPLLEALGNHGLLLVSATEPSMALSAARPKIPVLHADLLLDEKITETHIKQQLAEAEALAKKQGYALVVGRAFPVTVELLASWSRGLEAKGITLVPVTALAQGK